ANQALLLNIKISIKHWLGKMLTPGRGIAQQLNQFEREIRCGQFAVTQYLCRQISVIELPAHFLVKCATKFRKVFARDTQTRRHGVTAKLLDQMRITCRNRIK